MNRRELLDELTQVLKRIQALHAEFAGMDPELPAPRDKLIEMAFLQNHLDDLARHAHAFMEGRRAVERAMQ